METSTSRLRHTSAAPNLSSNATLITVLDSQADRWLLRAVCFDRDFRLDEVQGLFADAKLHHSDPLVIEFKGAYAIFLSYGVLIYWAGNESTFTEIMIRLEKSGHAAIIVQGKNELMVSVGNLEDLVNFREVQLRQLSVEHIKLVSESFGQSIALHRCDASAQDLLSVCKPAVEELRRKGDIKQSSKDLMRLVGRTLSLREETLSNLALLDTPPETWQSERLNRLHGQLYDYFQIKQRLSSVQAKLDYLLELNDALMSLVRHHESHRLEWIIIFLIIIEVIYSTIHFHELMK